MTTKQAGRQRPPPRKTPDQYPPWTPAEKEVVDRHATALLDGRYPEALAASRATRQELVESVWPPGQEPRSQEAVHIRLGNVARRLGRPATAARWTEAELRLMEQYARATAEGRYLSTFTASRDCAREMARLRGRRYDGRGRAVRRSAEAIRGKLFKRVAALLRARYNANWTAGEKRVVDRFARAVVAGAYPSAHQAARDCHLALARHSDRLRRRSGINLAAASFRSPDAVYLRVLQRTRELGRTPVHHQLWTPAEETIGRRVIGWYRASLRRRRPWSLAETARTIQAELLARGVTRSWMSCTSWLRSQLFPKEGQARKATRTGQGR